MGGDAGINVCMSFVFLSVCLCVYVFLYALVCLRTVLYITDGMDN